MDANMDPDLLPLESTNLTAQQSPADSVSQFQSASSPNNGLPSTSKQGLKKLLVGIVILLVIFAVGAMTFYIYNMNSYVPTLASNGSTIHIPNNPKSVQAQFMKDIINGNLLGAYGLTSTKFKAAVTEPQFALNEKELSIKQLSTVNVTLSQTGTLTVVKGNIVSKNVHIFSYGSRMVKQKGIWRVDNFVIQS